jgi:hypothetical protein
MEVVAHGPTSPALDVTWDFKFKEGYQQVVEAINIVYAELATTGQVVQEAAVPQRVSSETGLFQVGRSTVADLVFLPFVAR